MNMVDFDAYGKPIFGDAYDFPNDSNILADYVDTFANVRREPSAVRQGLVPGKRRAGMLFSETDTGMVYVDRGDGAWGVVSRPDTGWKTLTLSTGWSVYTGGEAPKYRVLQGRLQMLGRANATAAAGSVIGVIPVEYRPTSVGHLLVFTGWSDSHGIVELLVGHASGEIVCVQGASAVRGGISLAQINFPVG
jgi:hypothetical protein